MRAWPVADASRTGARVPVAEEDLLKELGIEYVRVPLGGQDHPYTPDAVDKFAVALDLARHLKLNLNEAVKHGEAINMRHLLEPLPGKKIRYQDGR